MCNLWTSCIMLVKNLAIIASSLKLALSVWITSRDQSLKTYHFSYFYLLLKKMQYLHILSVYIHYLSVFYCMYNVGRIHSFIDKIWQLQMKWRIYSMQIILYLGGKSMSPACWLWGVWRTWSLSPSSPGKSSLTSPASSSLWCWLTWISAVSQVGILIMIKSYYTVIWL